ncbi:MAG: response regulator transcription factor [Candidatus Adiutrix sp.]|nr:response regulator transcription factor [Candidatus Adiutrix sp.]
MSGEFNQDRSPRILVIEDEEDISGLLNFYLQSQGFEVQIAADGLTGFSNFTAAPPDLLLLDLMLPRMGGMEICGRLKRDERYRDIPIIMLSAKNNEADRILGLEVGADDYVIKPFSLQEVALRIKSQLGKTYKRPADRQAQAPTDIILEYGALLINPLKHEICWKNNSLHLTGLEFKLLYFLASRPDRVLDRQTLLRHIWGHMHDSQTRTVDTHMARLRDKLGEAEKCIETVRGVGFRFNPNFSR